MKSKVPLSTFLMVAKRISPKTSIPLVLAIHQGVNRFSALSEVYPMSSRTLSKAIRNMESEKIIAKQADGSYRLTKKGEEFARNARNIAKWAEKYYDIRLL